MRLFVPILNQGNNLSSCFMMKVVTLNRETEKKIELDPFPDEDDSNNILAQIRKGVKLKKVQKEVLRESFTLLPDTDPLTRSIHEALRRIKEASPESEDEEEALPCTDWEN